MAEVFGFDRPGMRRVTEAVRRVEATPIGGIGDPGQNDRKALLRRAIVTTAITAGTTTNAGAGMARLQRMNPTTGAYTDILNAAGSPLIVKVWNGYTSGVPLAGIIFVIPSGGQWHLIGYACP